MLELFLEAIRYTCFGVSHEIHVYYFLLRIVYMDTICFSQAHPIPSPPILILSSPTTFLSQPLSPCSTSCLCIDESPFTIHRSRTTFLKKTDSAFANSHQLLIASQTGVLCPDPLLLPYWNETHILTMCLIGIY